MDLHKLRLKLLKIGLVILGMTSWIFASFVLSTRPEESATPDTALTSLVRLPASLPHDGIEAIGRFGSVPRVSEPPRMELLKVNCWDLEKASLGTSSQWIRLVGGACGANLVTQVRNLTNGYSATVFSLANGKLTTDFIPMDVGSNDLEITLESEQATSQNHLIVVR
jgi:hypothetical protein